MLFQCAMPGSSRVGETRPECPTAPLLGGWPHGVTTDRLYAGHQSAPTIPPWPSTLVTLLGHPSRVSRPFLELDSVRPTRMRRRMQSSAAGASTDSEPRSRDAATSTESPDTASAGAPTAGLAGTSPADEGDSREEDSLVGRAAAAATKRRTAASASVHHHCLRSVVVVGVIAMVAGLAVAYGRVALAALRTAPFLSSAPALQNVSHLANASSAWPSSPAPTNSAGVSLEATPATSYSSTASVVAPQGVAPESSLARTPTGAASVSVSTSGSASSAPTAPMTQSGTAPASQSCSASALPTASLTGSPFTAPPVPSTAAPPEAATMWTRSPTVPRGFSVVRTWPHDSAAFTQGLQWWGATLYEGTGMYSDSRLRAVQPSAVGYEVTREVPFPDQPAFQRAFGEGIAVWRDSTGVHGVAGRDVVLQLTWQSRVMALYAAADFALIKTLPFATERNEGWGITHDGDHTLIVSDGGAYLHFWDDRTFQETRRVRVVDAEGRQRDRLNELEFVHGWVFANVWQTNTILIINPDSGRVAAEWDCSSLSRRVLNSGRDVLNGIAYSMAQGLPGSPGTREADQPWGGHMWITGKNWDTMFEVELADIGAPARRRRR